MKQANRLSLAFIAGVIALVVAFAFTLGYTAEAQDSEEQPQQEGSSQQENQDQNQQEGQQEQQQENQNQEGQQEQQNQDENQEQQQDQNQQEPQEQQDQEQDEGEVQGQQDDGASYDYVAQPGDSFTLMARKAIQTYGITEDVGLNNAQIVYAETMLTQEAGSPRLDVGQEVSIPQNRVREWVQNAQELSEEQIEAWQYYVQFVDSFNTNDVGEPRN